MQTMLSMQPVLQDLETELDNVIEKAMFVNGKAPPPRMQVLRTMN